MNALDALLTLEAAVPRLRRTTERQAERVRRLEAALNLALNIIGASEPGDSRAVSPEFVAMASVQAGCENDACMRIIEEGLLVDRRERVWRTPSDVKITILPSDSEEETGHGES